MDAGWAAFLGAIVGGLVTGGFGLVGQQALISETRKRELSKRRFECYRDFLSATHHAVIQISHVARAPMIDDARRSSGIEGGREFDVDPKKVIYMDVVEPLLDRVNSGYESTLLVGGPNVRAAAIALNDGLVTLEVLAQQREYSRADWRDARAAAVESLVREFRTAANAELDHLDGSAILR